MTALDAVLTRAAFLGQVHDPMWGRYCQTYANFVTGRTQGREIEFANNNAPLSSAFFGRWDDIDGARLSKLLMTAAKAAHSYYVSPTMQMLVTAAAEDWPEDECIREDDFPQPQGWLWLPSGLSVLDVRGRLMTTQVILWNVYGGGVDLHFLCDKTSPKDMLLPLPRDKWERLPRFTPWSHARIEWDSRLPLQVQMGHVLPPEVSERIVVTKEGNRLLWKLPADATPEERQLFAEQDFDVRQGVSPDAAWAVSCLRIMAQPLSSLTTLGLPAGVRRRLGRERVKMKDTQVTVIEYRQPRTDGHAGDSGRTLSHRHFRRGHWRKQPYKETDGTWTTKVIRIQPTIVGDSHLPLQMREHVNALLR